ncbi:MAG: tRNA pseudouridine(55) synthase TruB [Chlamydiae bacterium]|nr:tRNA pseudouridine(55) synthase TruB [Chlamydiota bacterium]
MSKEGILLVDKPKDKTSFYLVHVLRKITGVKKIGHTGTLDPLATGVMVMLIGSKYTKMTPQLIKHSKTYETTIILGKISDTYDIQGEVKEVSKKVPTLDEISEALLKFQGKISQIPPMYSAKKQNGKKLYELARKGIEIERPPVEVEVETKLLSYNYPYVKLSISCSSGTYIRSIAHDLGISLETGALVFELTRTSSGPFHLNECTPLEKIDSSNFSELLKEE